jgi:thiamine pyrophosphate-dependent acetolactate synthase large subunit-like protein
VTRTRPAAEAVAAAADLLVAARRPAVVAGRGAVLAGAREALEDLAELTGAVLATSALGNGLFAGHPYALGISGGFASPVAAGLLREADLVVAAGASLNMWTTRHGALIGPGARVVQIDCEVDAIGAHRPVDLGIVGDVAETARELAAILRARGHAATGYRTREVADRIAAGGWRHQPYDDAGTGERIDPRTLSIHLDRLLPPERLLAIDSGHFMGWPAMYIDVPDPQGFLFTQAFQSIGLGLAGAIGAAVARPDRLTVAALGDGGALMAAGELDTVGRLGLPLLVVVYNDAAYGAEVHHFGPHGEPLDTVVFPDSDFAALGRAAGSDGVTVRRVEDLAAVETWIADRPGPLVVDAKVEPTVVAEWLSEAFRAH